MQNLLKIYVLTCVTFIIGCGNKNDIQQSKKNDEVLENIIPKPNQINLKSGTFSSDQFNCFFDSNFEPTKNIITSILPSIKITDEANANIIFKKNEALKDEQYLLNIDSKKIVIESRTNIGALHGIQSLKQLMPLNGKISIPCLVIDDTPRFQYRGMHLDVARHFFDVTFIKKYIDILSMYKVNNFHWHLTDDQGWRIEIKKYPKLNQIAAYRNETLIGHYNDNPQKFDGKKYGGFYTQEEIKEVIKYASERNINVIPEIEMPGHAQAAISAYPELGCTGKKVSAATKWGVFDDVFCPNEKTFTFLEDVLSEVIELFPSKYIHIGGDECPKTQWEKNALCQSIISKNNLKDVHGLQSYFIQRMEKFINSKGRQIIGWDEILEGGLAPNATVMSWRGVQGGIDAAKQKHNVIMTPTDYCYLDYYQSKSTKEPLAIGGYLPLQKVYSYEPIPEQLSAEEAKYVLGTQGNLWTEYIDTPEKLTYMVLPRMQALAEIGWTQKENKSYENFAARLNYHFGLWKKMGLNFADKSSEVNSKIIAGDGNGVSIKLTTNGSKLPLKYSFDSPLNNQSPNALEPIKIEKSTTLYASVLNGDNFENIDTINFLLHKGAGKKITLTKKPSEKYSADGICSLLNGVIGPSNSYGSEWLGFEGDNLEAFIDLGTIMPINEIKTRFFNGPGQWIYPPKSVSVFFSQDNKNFNEMPAFTVRPSNEKIIDFTIPTANTKTRYIKINIANYGIIPTALQGGGHPAWLFVDEIILN